MGCIYVIKNNCNKKVYVGQTTKTARERFLQHIRDSKKENANYDIYLAFRELGIEKFYYEVIEEDVPEEELVEKEMYYIEKFDSCNNGYNIRKGGKGGRVFSFSEIEELKAKAKKGTNAIKLSKEYGVHVETVYRALHEFGFRYYNTDDERIRKEFDSGKTLKEISEICSIDPKTVSRHLRKMGLWRRKKNSR